MPLYDFACDPCHAVVERLAKPSETLACEACGTPMARLISLPIIRPDAMTPYYDHGLGERIESRSQRQRSMKAAGLVEQGGSRLHGAKGTVFSFPGRTTQSVAPSGAYAKRGGD